MLSQTFLTTIEIELFPRYWFFLYYHVYHLNAIHDLAKIVTLIFITLNCVLQNKIGIGPVSGTKEQESKIKFVFFEKFDCSGKGSTGSNKTIRFVKF